MIFESIIFDASYCELHLHINSYFVVETSCVSVYNSIKIDHQQWSSLNDDYLCAHCALDVHWSISQCMYVSSRTNVLRPKKNSHKSPLQRLQMNAWKIWRLHLDQNCVCVCVTKYAQMSDHCHCTRNAIFRLWENRNSNCAKIIICHRIIIIISMDSIIDVFQCPPHFDSPIFMLVLFLLFSFNSLAHFFVLVVVNIK